jgi:hypothetical protein
MLTANVPTQKFPDRYESCWIDIKNMLVPDPDASQSGQKRIFIDLRSKSNAKGLVVRISRREDFEMDI